MHLQAYVAVISGLCAFVNASPIVEAREPAIDKRGPEPVETLTAFPSHPPEFFGRVGPWPTPTADWLPAPTRDTHFKFDLSPFPPDGWKPDPYDPHEKRQQITLFADIIGEAAHEKPGLNSLPWERAVTTAIQLVVYDLPGNTCPSKDDTLPSTLDDLVKLVISVYNKCPIQRTTK